MEMASPIVSGRPAISQSHGNRLRGLLATCTVDGHCQLIDGPIVGLPVSQLPAQQAVAVEEGGKERTQGLGGLILADRLLFLDAVTYRLTEQRVSMLLAGEVEQDPGTPRQNHSVDVDVVLDKVLEIVVGLIDRSPGRGGEDVLGRRHVLASRPRAWRLRLHRPPISGQLKLVHRLVRAATRLLDVVGVPVKNLEDRQCPLCLREGVSRGSRFMGGLVGCHAEFPIWPRRRSPRRDTLCLFVSHLRWIGLGFSAWPRGGGKSSRDAFTRRLAPTGILMPRTSSKWPRPRPALWPRGPSKNSGRRKPPCGGLSSLAQAASDSVRCTANREPFISGEAKSPTQNPSVTARPVAGIFFPQRPGLRLTPHNSSPSVLGKILRSSAREPSFQEATAALEELAEVTIRSRQVGRIARRVGLDALHAILHQPADGRAGLDRAVDEEDQPLHA